MTLKEKNKLIKQIEKYYYSHGQRLILNTWELIQHNDQDCSFDIYLADSNIGLFTIQNYNGLRDLDIINKSYFKESIYNAIETWDGVKASYLPLYYNDVITLKTFKPITKKDIIKATRYFVREILDIWAFNFEFVKEKKDGKKRKTKKK